LFASVTLSSVTVELYKFSVFIWAEDLYSSNRFKQEVNDM